MGRPPRHTTDDLLDAAVRLFATSGLRAITMSAVAREAGAPSGSVYHRFADRPALLAALWLRTVRRFQAGYLATLSAEPPVEAAVEAVAYGVRWCREHPGQALVLHAGRRALGHTVWSAEDQAAAQETDRHLETALRTAFRALRTVTGRTTDELLLVLVDLPHAAVRRYLERGEAPPPRAVGTAVRVARTLLTSGGEADA